MRDARYPLILKPNRTTTASAIALVLVGCLAWAPPSRAEAGAIATDKPGPYAVKTILDDWKDTKRRGRVVPVKLYLPDTSKSKAASKSTAGEAKRFPVIIFSHGLGGSREGYSFLGEHWASHGYVSVHLQHAGSDEAVWKDVPAARRLQALKASLRNPMATIHRPLDVRFAIDTLAIMNADRSTPLRGKLDLRRIGMVGHSFGSWTTLAVGGQQFINRRGKAISLPDDRIKAMIPMSSPAPKDPKQYKVSFEKIAIPALHMTGTLDTSPVTDTTPKQRRVPFDYSPGPEQGGKPQYLITFKDGDHMVFAGRSLPGRAQTPPDAAKRMYGIIQASTLAFWEAYLKDSDRAKAWLDDGGLARRLGKDGKLEAKVAAKAK